MRAPLLICGVSMGRAASRSFGAQGCSPVKFLDEERQDTVGSAAGRLCGAGADPACVPHREEASREGLEAVRNRIGLYITQILRFVDIARIEAISS